MAGKETKNTDSILSDDDDDDDDFSLVKVEKNENVLTKWWNTTT